MFCIYLKCNNGTGYFTGIYLNSMSREIKVHPAKYNAYKFETSPEAYKMAQSLKNQFKCIISYKIEQL